METTNNNVSMKTVVETFIIEETQELMYDNDQLTKWNGLIEELGLEGQKKVVVADKSPIPYLYMNEALVQTFKTLCPKAEDIKAYNKTPIPVEILSLVSMSTKEQHFFKIQIWHNEKEPDPVCIGINKNENYNASYGDWHTRGYNHYLIGRWADVKQSLDELVKRARALFVATTKSDLQKQIRNAQTAIENIEHDADVKFGTAMPTTDGLPF